MTRNKKTAPVHVERLKLVRDVLMFQVKLVMDGLRDLLLSPISLTAAGLGFLIHPEEPDRYFRRLQQLGRQSDRWINLFDEYDKQGAADQLLQPLEERMSAEYEKGGWLSKGAEHVNRTIDGLHGPRDKQGD
ncbi:MAG: hypothetical protein AAF525_20760 [Pseudomonadota bacterium]